VEYKYKFSTRDGFNHPFSLTDVIVCWEWDIPQPGDTISDDLDYSATIERLIDLKEHTIGLWLTDVRRQDGGGELPTHRIRLLCLGALLQATFEVSWRRNSRVPQGPAKQARAVKAPPPPDYIAEPSLFTNPLADANALMAPHHLGEDFRNTRPRAFDLE